MTSCSNYRTATGVNDIAPSLHCTLHLCFYQWSWNTLLPVRRAHFHRFTSLFALLLYFISFLLAKCGDEARERCTLSLGHETRKHPYGHRTPLSLARKALPHTAWIPVTHGSRVQQCTVYVLLCACTLICRNRLCAKGVHPPNFSRWHFPAWDVNLNFDFVWDTPNLDSVHNWRI